MKGNPDRHGMDMVVKVIAHRLKGFIFLFGAYLVMSGYKSPGGGFSGGIVIACVLVLLTLAEGQPMGLNSVGKHVAAVMGSLAALIILLIFAAGMFLPAGIRARFLPAGLDLMHLYDICIAVAVSMLVFVVFTIFSATHIEEKGGKRRMIMRGRGK